MDIGGLGERQSFHLSANMPDLKNNNAVPEHNADKNDKEKPITEIQKSKHSERLEYKGVNDSTKIQIERQRQKTPNVEEFHVTRSEDGFDILA